MISSSALGCSASLLAILVGVVLWLVPDITRWCGKELIGYALRHIAFLPVMTMLGFFSFDDFLTLARPTYVEWYLFSLLVLNAVIAVWESYCMVLQAGKTVEIVIAPVLSKRSSSSPKRQRCQSLSHHLSDVIDEGNLQLAREIVECTRSAFMRSLQALGSSWSENHTYLLNQIGRAVFGLQAALNASRNLALLTTVQRDYASLFREIWDCIYKRRDIRAVHACLGILGKLLKESPQERLICLVIDLMDLESATSMLGKRTVGELQVLARACMTRFPEREPIDKLANKLQSLAAVYKEEIKALSSRQWRAKMERS